MKKLFHSLGLLGVLALTSCSLMPEATASSETTTKKAVETTTVAPETSTKETTTVTPETTTVIPETTTVIPETTTVVPETTTVVPETTTEEPTETTTASVVNPYSFYDETYDANTYTIRKISALKNKDDFIKGFDLSLVQGILEAGGKYYTEDGKEESIYKILKDNGINTARVRLFNDYTASDGAKAGHLDINNVITMLKASQDAGLKTLLDLHYSDTWSDPGSQTCPLAWKDYSYDEIVTAVYDYTKDVLTKVSEAGISLDYIQIGNEINSGLIWDYGAIDYTSDETTATSFKNIAGILASGIKAVREVSEDTKIILHTANGLNAYQNSDSSYSSAGVWFFNQLKSYNLDYDIAGSSFYTFYSPDTPVSVLHQMIDELGTATGKDVLVMEFSYAFTYAWNDNTHNMFYTDKEQEDYPVTIQGQTNLILDMIEQAAKSESGIGVLYWGGEWIPLADEDISSNWANQALFTYEGWALPSLRAFKECE